MEKIRSFKAISTEIDALADITNKETFRAAIPLLVELSVKLQRTRSTLAKMSKVYEALNEEASQYALDHQSVFVAKQLVADGKGVERGDVETEGGVIHFSHGFDGYRRSDGGKKTQDFLKGLPQGWTKCVLDLSTTGINNESPSAEELAKYKLEMRPKNLWSIGETETTSDAE